MQGLLYFVAYNTTIAGLRFRLDNPAIVMYDCVWQLNMAAASAACWGKGGGGCFDMVPQHSLCNDYES